MQSTAVIISERDCGSAIRGKCHFEYRNKMQEIILEYLGLLMADVSAGQYKCILEEIMVLKMLK